MIRNRAERRAAAPSKPGPLGRRLKAAPHPLKARWNALVDITRFARRTPAPDAPSAHRMVSTPEAAYACLVCRQPPPCPKHQPLAYAAEHPEEAESAT